ncbi:MAG: metallophosphoesterase, partial [Myxococcota bacterium]|nr:metallophosphoesterase [Myxococcota bacterium]
MLLGPAPADAAADVTRFLVVGHLRGDATGELWPWLDVLVEDARRLAPDRVFLTGDLVWGDYNVSPVDAEAVEADWERLDAALARIGAPVHRVPGNHDTNDPVTRALFERRYGSLPRALRHRDDLFVLMDSTRTDPATPPRLPRPHARVDALPEPRVEALGRLLEEGAPYRHAFVFLHHVLWWEEDAPWWRDVHPLLQEAGVRAVFAGDFGPLKLSHVARDGVAYWQSAVEGPTGM